MAKRKMLEIEGKRRDYDVALYCIDKHYNEAVDFMNDWLNEDVDALELGEVATIKVTLVEKDEDEPCYLCNPDHYSMANEP